MRIKYDVLRANGTVLRTVVLDTRLTAQDRNLIQTLAGFANCKPEQLQEGTEIEDLGILIREIERNGA